MKKHILVALAAIAAAFGAAGLAACHSHDYVASETVDPTCWENGYIVYTCSCGDTYTEYLDPLGHDMAVTQTVEPSCYQKGYTVYTCTRDDYTYTEYTDPLGHTFANGVCTVCGTPEPTDGLSYASDDGLTYFCTGIGTATATDIVIANVYNGKPVEAIAYGAFSEEENITGVTVPAGIELGTRAFYMCTSLQTVTLCEGVERISDRAFSECSNLKSITVPDSVTYIGISAFYRCTALEKAILSENSNLTYIAGFAFSSCTALKEIFIPKNVETIGDYALGYDASLTTITVDGENAHFAGYDGILFNKDRTAIVIYPAGKTATSYTVPDGVKSIAAYAFTDCRNLSSIVISDGAETIEDYAFDNCNLTTLTLPNSLKSLGSRILFAINSIEEIIFRGTTDEWNALRKADDWLDGCYPQFTVRCNDGTLVLNENNNL